MMILNNKRKIERSSNNIYPKDVLGAVSDEDILKLAQLTAILPEVNKSKRIHNRHRSGTHIHKYRIVLSKTNFMIYSRIPNKA